MKLVTKQTRISGVCAAWERQYSNYIKDKVKGWEKWVTILDALRALPETATEDDIERIIGNRSWTAIRCHECEKWVDAAVVLDKTLLCQDCLINALALLGAEWQFQMTKPMTNDQIAAVYEERARRMALGQVIEFVSPTSEQVLVTDDGPTVDAPCSHQCTELQATDEGINKICVCCGADLGLANFKAVAG